MDAFEAIHPENARRKNKHSEDFDAAESITLSEVAPSRSAGQSSVPSQRGAGIGAGAENTAHVESAACPQNSEASAAPPSVNYVQEVRPDDPPPSCRRCGAVMVPTRFNCRSCGATKEPTEAAPPSEREAFEKAELDIYVRQGYVGGFDIWKAARAAVPQAAPDREALKAELIEEIKHDPASSFFGMTLTEIQRCICESQARAAAVPAPGEAQRNEFLRLFEDDLSYYEQRHKHKSWLIMQALKRAERLFVAGATAPPKEAK